MSDLPTQDADRDDGVTKASPQAKAAKRVVRRAATRMIVGSGGSRLNEMILTNVMAGVDVHHGERTKLVMSHKNRSSLRVENPPAHSAPETHALLLPFHLVARSSLFSSWRTKNQGRSEITATLAICLHWPQSHDKLR